MNVLSKEISAQMTKMFVGAMISYGGFTALNNGIDYVFKKLGIWE